MNQVDNLEFKVTMPIQKSDADDGRWVIKGIAAGAGFVDKAGDELLPQAIESLAAQINESPVPFRDWHKTNSISADMGYVVKAMVTPDWQLEVEVELDQDNNDAQYLWKKLEKGKKYGMSVRGNSERPIIEKGDGRYISKHHTIHLSEISATTEPFFTKSLGTVIRKAIDDAMPSLATGENTIMADSKIEGETPVAQESSAPENDTAATEASPSEQLVKSLMADEEFVGLIKSTVSDTVSEAMKAAQPEETTTEDNTEIEKSEETEEAQTEETPAASESDVAEIVKSAVEEVSKAFAAQIEELANRIPDTSAPAVLVKSEEETIQDALKDMSPSERIRLGLAAQRGELDKIK